MFELVVAQSNEVEKAVIGMGEYRFKSAYKHVEVSSDKWFFMTMEQRQAHLKKVFSMVCVPLESETSHSIDSGMVSATHLSVSPEKSGITAISPESLENTWKKAEKLLNTDGSICKAPGMPDSMCVASASGSRPHIVSKTKKGSFACDDACVAWKSTKFCSHVLAVAERANCLSEFLSSYRRAKITCNYTAASTHSVSKNVGKKPGCPKRKGPAQCKKPSIERYVDPLPHCTVSSS